jgi:hypothetical protein
MGRRQPAQRPTIAQDGVFLNHGMQDQLGRWLATSTRLHMLPNRLARRSLPVKR